jgi:hypothetical protein
MRGARCSKAPNGFVRNAQSLLQIFRGHGVNRVAQGDMDAQENRAQLVIGEHHANRNVRNGFAEKGGRLRLQQFGVSGVGDASRSQCFLVQGRRHDCADLLAKSRLCGPYHAVGSRPDPPRRSRGLQRPAPGAAASGAPVCSAAASQRPPAARRYGTPGSAAFPARSRPHWRGAGLPYRRQQNSLR